MALDGDTGKLKWHFQFTPNDSHDWDSTHVPVLFDADVRGTRRKLVAVANRNAFYYVLDRGSGEFLEGRAYAKQTWAKGLDDRGRPIVIPGTEPSDEGTLVWPNLNGATVWFSPSYSPREGLLYVATREIASIYFKRKAEYKPGTFFSGGGEAKAPGPPSGAIRALDAATGQIAHRSVGRRSLHCRRTRVLRLRRGQLLRARRQDRQAAVGFPNRRRHRGQSDFLQYRRQTVRRDRRGPRPLCLFPVGTNRPATAASN